MDDKNKSIGFLSGLLHREAYKYFEKRMGKIGVHKGMIPLMKMLYCEDGVSQQTLCENIQVDKANVTRMLKRLETNGTIERRENPADGRSNLIYLTQKGKEMQPKFHAILVDWSEILTKGIDEDKKEMLRFLLKKCITNAQGHLAENGDKIEE